LQIQNEAAPVPRRKLLDAVYLCLITKLQKTDSNESKCLHHPTRRDKISAMERTNPYCELDDMDFPTSEETNCSSYLNVSLITQQGVDLRATNFQSGLMWRGRRQPSWERDNISAHVTPWCCIK